MRIALAFLVAGCLLPRTAHAGRSFYGWLYGTEVMPERGVELQTWIFEENNRYGGDSRDSSLWWGPLIGVTDQLEIALPIELEWSSSEAEKTAFTFRRYGVEARYRLVSSDQSDGFVPLVRVAVKRDVTVRDDVHVEGDAVASYQAGPFHMLIDVGYAGDVTPNSQHNEVRPGAGISLRVGSELRVGGEVYSELSLDPLGQSWALAGPDLSWTHGRFWLTGALGIGLYHVRLAPRFMWGIAF